jgi:phosphotransferase system HPr (HPr) family protein
MEIKKLKISDPNGLHMRQAAKVVESAKKYKSKIYLCHRCKFADTCSILEVLTLAAAKDAEIAVIVDGPDEREAIEEISQSFSNGAGI